MQKKRKPNIFENIAHYTCAFQNNSLPLHPKAQRRGLEGGRCPPLGKPNHLTQSPVVAFKTYLKGVYYALF